MKYRTMDRCRAGTLQQRKTSALAAMMPDNSSRTRGNQAVRLAAASASHYCLCLVLSIRSCDCACLTCYRSLTFRQTEPPLVDLKQPVRDATA